MMLYLSNAPLILVNNTFIQKNDEERTISGWIYKLKKKMTIQNLHWFLYLFESESNVFGETDAAYLTK